MGLREHFTLKDAREAKVAFESTAITAPAGPTTTGGYQPSSPPTPHAATRAVVVQRRANAGWYSIDINEVNSYFDKAMKRHGE